MSQLFSISEIKTKRIPYRIIFWTAILAGTLDIAAAMINSNLRTGTGPITVLQFIASGVLGREAFSGGLLTAFSSLVFHYFIAFIWTLIFFIIYPGFNLSPKYKIIAGLSYVILIWLIMNLVVLPLSNIPQIPFQFSQVLPGLSFIMFLVGIADLDSVSHLL